MLVNADDRSFTVSGAHPALPGHFPGRPVVPGVLVLEAVLELAGPSAHGIRGAKFLSPLAPDERALVSFSEARGVAAFRVTSESGAEIARGDLLLDES